MNKIYTSFTPAAETDAFILAAARINLARRHARKIIWRMTAGGMAACMVFGILLYSSETGRKQQETEMLSMWDFSKLESDMYALDINLDNGNSTLATL